MKTDGAPIEAGAVYGRSPKLEFTMLDRITTRIFTGGAEPDGILTLAADPRISGFTANPPGATVRSR